MRIVFIISFLLAPLVSLADDIKPPEASKFFTEDGTVAEKGKFELQTIYTFSTATHQFDSNSNNIDRESTNTHTLTKEITYGLLDTLEVSLDIGWAFLNDNDSNPSTGNGLTDLVLIPKWNFYTSKNNWSFVYSPVLVIPIGDESDADEIGPGQGFWTIDQKIAVTKNWGNLTFNTDVGFALPLGEKRETYRGTLYWDGALGYQVTPLLNLFLKSIQLTIFMKKMKKPIA